jgi:hypothetical protein
MRGTSSDSGGLIVGWEYIHVVLDITHDTACRVAATARCACAMCMDLPQIS